MRNDLESAIPAGVQRRGWATVLRRGLWAVGLAALIPALAPISAKASVAGQPVPRQVPASHVPGGNFGYSVALSGTTAVIGALGANGHRAAYLYARSGGAWRRQATVADPPHASGDIFGYSVAVSGGTAVVGAWGTDNHAGAAYVYARSGRTWHLQATLTGPGRANDAFGYSVAASGNTVVIGSFSVGAAYVYVRAGGRWHQQAALPGPAGSSIFGAAVGISGQTAVIGAWGTSNQAGAAYIFTRSGGIWHQQATLASPRGTSQDHFASAVAVSGSTAVIGAPAARDDDAGATYIYTRSGATWHRQATLADPVGHADDHFGWSVTASGPRVLSGAPSTGSACGAAYEYTHSRGRWHKRVTVVEPRCNSQDNVGFGVALSGRLAVIGSPGKNAGAGDVITVRVP